jgi:hypothetical protein
LLPSIFSTQSGGAIIADFTRPLDLSFASPKVWYLVGNAHIWPVKAALYLTPLTYQPILLLPQRAPLARQPLAFVRRCSAIFLIFKIVDAVAKRNNALAIYAQSVCIGCNPLFWCLLPLPIVVSGYSCVRRGGVCSLLCYPCVSLCPSLLLCRRLLIALILVTRLDSPALAPVPVSECDALSLVTFDALRVAASPFCSFPALLVA